MVNKILDAFLPNFCYLCGMASHSGIALCLGCQSSLARNNIFCARCSLPLPIAHKAHDEVNCAECQAEQPPFSQVVAPWLYDEHMAFLIHKWKFQGETQITTLLANLFTSAWDSNAEGIDMIVPVPLHWRRLWQRGFNQAESLARKIQSMQTKSQRTKIDSHLLARVEATGPQSTLGITGRIDNLHNAFRARKKCVGLNIALVDDVMTTGSTAAAATKCLIEAGANAVDVWCIARTPSPNHNDMQFRLS